jgi:hypothetical protein
MQSQCFVIPAFAHTHDANVAECLRNGHAIIRLPRERQAAFIERQRFAVSRSLSEIIAHGEEELRVISMAGVSGRHP